MNDIVQSRDFLKINSENQSISYSPGCTDINHVHCDPDTQFF